MRLPQLIAISLFALGCQEYDLLGQPDPVEDPEDLPPPEEADPGDMVVDVFEWEGEFVKSDVLIFGDTSGSMSAELVTMGDHIAEFVSRLEAYDTDWQLMTVTGRGGCSTSGVLRPTTPGYEQRFRDGIEDDPLFGDESGLISAEQALIKSAPGECNQGFMRADAMLHVIFISDENDESPGSAFNSLYWQDYLYRMVQLKGDPNMIKFSGVIGEVPNGCNGADPGEGYWELLNATGGEFLSICTDWSQDIDVLADASVIRDVFPLTGIPDPTTFVVRVNTIDRPQSDWEYNAADNTMMFVENLPVAGDKVVVAYQLKE